jgi:NAD(P)-dependent dehydrogenase (short-subunit alcohol dehydrogenase family)
MNLQGAVAVITGGTGAMGTEIAKFLAEEGATVAKWDLVPDTAGHIACDVSDPNSVNEAMRETVARYGTPSILVNAAGVSGGKSPRAVEATDDDWHLVLSSTEAWHAVFNVNILGVVNTSRAFARLLRDHGGGGAIVNISSTGGGPMNNGVLTAYSASKAAVNKITRIAAIDFGPLGIRVNAVAPGTMEVRMRATGTSAAPTPQGQAGGGGAMDAAMAATPVERRAGRASDIAQAVLSLLAADFVTGEILTVDGGQMLARAATTSGPPPIPVAAPS